MTYDNWKCTNPADEFLGPPPCEDAWQWYKDGELSMGELGEILIEHGYSPLQVRKMLSRDSSYPIPVGYFGQED